MSYGGGGYRNPRSGGGRFDAKELSRQRRELIALDPDIRGRDDLEDDDLDVPQAPQHTRVSRPPTAQRRGDAQLQRGATSARNPLVTLVSVRNCASSGLKYILKLIGNCFENFRPIAPQVKDMDIEFFIVDDKQADAIRLMNRRIPDRRNGNTRLIINIRRTSAPWSILDKRMRDTIDNVLKKRYNKATNALDLSDFAADNVFLSNKMICNLSRNDVMVYVCNAVEREYSDISGLSLKDNRLRSLVYPSSLSWRAKDVKILDLSNNDFTKIDDLERISFWNIEKLHLENNPLCAVYTDADKYTSDVQTHFPSLTYLDGYNVQPLAPPAPESRSQLLPNPKLSYCDNDDVRKIVEKFLSEYYSLFDDVKPDARKQLVAAYQSDAEFSYCINTLESGGYARGDYDIYGQWLRGSRNIVFEDKWIGNPDRVKYKEAMEIAVALSKLPATYHLVDTFLLDITFCMGNLCGFTLRGLLRDGKDRENDRAHVKMFMRHFLVVSTGEGQLAIICDTLHICPITRDAERSYRALLAQARNEAQQADMPGPSGLHQPQYSEITGASNNSSAALPSIVVTAPPPTPTPVVDANIKRQMVEQFSQQTGMKMPYAERCLEDNNYDYEAAGRRFLEIRSSIPAEAFL